MASAVGLGSVGQLAGATRESGSGILCVARAGGGRALVLLFGGTGSLLVQTAPFVEAFLPETRFCQPFCEALSKWHLLVTGCKTRF